MGEVGLKLDERGVAGLFLLSHCRGAGSEEQEALANIIKLAFETGVMEGAKHMAEIVKDCAIEDCIRDAVDYELKETRKVLKTLD